MPHDYELRWTCHSCGKEIGDQDKFVIIAGKFVYHVEHQPKETTDASTQEGRQATA